MGLDKMARHRWHGAGIYMLDMSGLQNTWWTSTSDSQLMECPDSTECSATTEFPCTGEFDPVLDCSTC